MEVETGSVPVPRDSSSSSGYSSAPNSPMTPKSRDVAFDKSKDLHRREFSHLTDMAQITTTSGTDLNQL